jgi:hypothetical protein
MAMTKRACILIIVATVVAVLFIALGISGPLLITQELSSGIRQTVVIDSFDAPGFSTWQNNT